MNPVEPAGLLFVIAGPSGAGKSSLVRGVVGQVPGVEVSVSHTTRPARPGERHGREYHFVEEAEFQRLENEGRMLETARVFGHRYGTSRDWVEERRRRGKDVLLEIDWQGAAEVRRAEREAITIQILPPSLEALEHRLRARGQDSDTSIEVRMESAGQELSHYRDFDYLVVNERFEEALDEITAILRAERARTRTRVRSRSALLQRLLPGREESVPQDASGS